jgi:hypothetical protein
LVSRALASGQPHLFPSWPDLFGPPMITVLDQWAWVTRTSRVMTI